MKNETPAIKPISTNIEVGTQQEILETITGNLLDIYNRSMSFTSFIKIMKGDRKCILAIPLNADKEMYQTFFFDTVDRRSLPTLSGLATLSGAEKKNAYYGCQVHMVMTDSHLYKEIKSTLKEGGIVNETEVALQGKSMYYFETFDAIGYNNTTKERGVLNGFIFLVCDTSYYERLLSYPDHNVANDPQDSEPAGDYNYALEVEEGAYPEYGEDNFEPLTQNPKKLPWYKRLLNWLGF